MKTVANLAAMIAGSTAVQAEGTREVIACRYVTTCNQDAECSPASGTVAFEFEAVEVMHHGEGTYRLRYGDQTVEMVLADPYGPKRWVDSNALLNSLTGTGPASMLWIQQTFQEEMTSKVHFLDCEDNL